MASLRQIRSRLRSITSTKQIMRAMQLVSGSKLKRAQSRLFQFREVLGFLDGLLQRVMSFSPGLAHPLAAPRADPRHRATAFGRGPDSSRETIGWAGCRPSGAGVQNPQALPLGLQGTETLVLFTSDTGLCGSYNANLIQLAEATLRRDTQHRTQIIYIGRRGHRHFTKRGYPAAEAYLHLAGRPDLAKAEEIGRLLMEQFLSGRTSAIHLLYSNFLSSSVFRPTLAQWLPITLSTQHTAHSTQAHGNLSTQAQDYIFEPSAARVFEDLLPRWALAKFQLILLEAFTSEHSARMITMKNATDNAEEILKALTMQRNKIRQASITKEISEIVGTAEALK